MSERPHKFPASIPDGEIVAWCCAACNRWVSEYRRGEQDECPVGWRTNTSRNRVAAVEALVDAWDDPDWQGRDAAAPFVRAIRDALDSEGEGDRG